MKIIQGLKEIKDLKVKADDLKTKVHKHCAHLSFESPVYPDQKDQVSKWLQAHSDVIKEISRLQLAIAKTNLDTMVTIKLGDKNVVKSITEWIYRRRDLAAMQQAMYKSLTDRGLQEKGTYTDSQEDNKEYKIVRCYDPVERDNKIELYRSEPSIVDATLEVINATTDLIE